MTALSIVLIVLGVVVLFSVANGSWQNAWTALTGKATA